MSTSPLVVDGPPFVLLGQLVSKKRAREIRAETREYGHERDGIMVYHPPMEHRSLKGAMLPGALDLTPVKLAAAEEYPGPEWEWTGQSIVRTGPGVNHPTHNDSRDNENEWLGFVLSLCDPASYTGGTLSIGQVGPGLKNGMVTWCGQDPELVRLPLGHGLLIRGDVPHRVYRVKSGERCVLIMDVHRVSV